MEWTIEDAREYLEVLVMNAGFGNVQRIRAKGNERVYVLSELQYSILTGDYLSENGCNKNLDTKKTVGQ